MVFVSHDLGHGISVTLAEALAGRGISQLFPIQSQVVPHALDGRDVLAKSPTGSGKTLAFGIPLVQRLDPTLQTGRSPQALVLVPTRELATQVADEMRELIDAAGVRIATVFGGVGVKQQARNAANADVLVACPGRLEDLLGQRLISLNAVRCLVLDEADRMLDMGFQPAVDRIVKQVPADRQTMFFSATLDGAVGKVAGRYTRDALLVDTGDPTVSTDAIGHEFASVTHEAKLERLLDVLDRDRGLAVVFVRTKRGADRICRKLRARGVNAGALHGGMVQNRRTRELERFECGALDVLVVTDVFARGIDLDGISHVINFDPPGDADAYVHRIGRTGRAGRTGTGITFVMDDQLGDVGTIVSTLDLHGQWQAGGFSAVRKDEAKRPPRQRSRRGARVNPKKVAAAAARQPVRGGGGSVPPANFHVDRDRTTNNEKQR